MSPGQMLPGQTSQWKFESVLNVARNLLLLFYQNWVSNSWDIAGFEFLWVGWWVVCKVIFVSNPTKVMLDWGWVELLLSWGFDGDVAVSTYELQLVSQHYTLGEHVDIENLGQRLKILSIGHNKAFHTILLQILPHFDVNNICVAQQLMKWHTLK